MPSSDASTGPDDTTIDPRLVLPISTVIDPCSQATGVPLNLLEMGLVRRAVWHGDHVEVDLRLTSPVCWYVAPMMEAVQRAITHHCGVTRVDCTADSGLEWESDMISASARHRLQALRPVPLRSGDDE